MIYNKLIISNLFIYIYKWRKELKRGIIVDILGKEFLGKEFPRKRINGAERFIKEKR
tara:strand:- start:14 stop:184 length:171 start_codon:yes stop_codon:yes gene_type:complete